MRDIPSYGFTKNLEFEETNINYVSKTIYWVFFLYLTVTICAKNYALLILLVVQRLKDFVI
jgi:hypothetical protein